MRGKKVGMTKPNQAASRATDLADRQFRVLAQNMRLMADSPTSA
ncbi:MULTISPECIES: hypothetical protein [Nocardia]|nr:MULTISPECIES: hypothetical protein [Nocardia]